MKKIIARTLPESRFPDTILLLLRFLVGITMMTHGVAKLLSFRRSCRLTFPDPIGFGKFPLFAHDYWCGSRLLPSC